MTRTPSSTSESHLFSGHVITSKSLGQLVIMLSASLAPIAAAQAAIIQPIGLGGFSDNASLIDFGDVASNAPIDMQTIGGVTFGFTVDGIASDDATVADIPGNTNNISVPNIEGDAHGTLSMVFPEPQLRFGYGWAVDGDPTSAKSTKVELFDASNLSMGSITIDGSFDPNFIGGFAGVKSNMPFVRAEVTWLFDTGSRFAVDNIHFEPIPEPATLLPALLALLGAGVVVGSRYRLSATA